MTEISRRTALKHAAGITGAAALGTALLPAAPAAADDRFGKAVEEARRTQRKIRTGEPSANGWEMEKAADSGGAVWTRPVSGTDFGVATRIEGPGTVLVHVIRRFHYEISALEEGDVTGWTHPDAVEAGLAESNLASGTAVSIRPGHYPRGARGGFFPGELTVVRDILAELEGVVRWGGDERTPHEALFFLGVPPGDPRLNKAVGKLERWAYEPEAGAGTHVDVFSPQRRKEARALRERQRSV
ncbi:hypothetical protein CUT44_30900 [Streptomyces carminius]|uniref:Uncharacterized protein n=1 Tax=Streptomyces carminius TaxID=2665496 RepID=A0A2M8LPS6_9ACTN|nr:hypothetical protein [Streptomyces carminius]PJE93957.1 hypothetical protein CUT44_30900 [Streptomyces carminius]